MCDQDTQFVIEVVTCKCQFLQRLFKKTHQKSPDLTAEDDGKKGWSSTDGKIEAAKEEKEEEEAWHSVPE